VASGNRLADAYLVALGAVGVVYLGFHFGHLRWAEAGPLALFVLLGIGVEALVIQVPGGPRLTVAFPLALASYILWGEPAALVIASAGSLVGNGIIRRRPWRVTLFNSGQRALSVGAGAALCRLLVGRVDPRVAAGFPEALCFMPGYFVVNQLLVNAYFILRDPGQHHVERWREVVRWDLLSYAFGVPVGFLFVLLYRHYGVPGIIGVYLCLLAVAYNLRLQLYLHGANRELTVLHEVAQQMTSSLDLDRVFGIVVEAVELMVGCDSCVLFLRDSLRQELYPAASRLPQGDELGGDFRIPEGQGIIGKAAADGEPKLVEDLLRKPDAGDELPASWQPRSLMAAPLRVEGQTVGVIAVGHREPGRFNRDSLRLLNILTHQAAVAIQNAMLYRRTQHLAITDPLTNLYNYRYLYMRLAEELRKARMAEQPVALIYLDLDDFKQYNDAYGHQVGDGILQQYASVLRSVIRDTDVAVRYAGDEFVVILPNTDRSEAERVAHRIATAVANHRFDGEANGRPVRLSVSAGVAVYPHDGHDERALVAAADHAMYEGKRKRAEGGQGERKDQ